MKNYIKNLIIIVLTIGFIWYVYIILTNWQLTTDGNLWVGIIRILIPFSVDVLSYLILYEKIEIYKFKRRVKK